MFRFLSLKQDQFCTIIFYLLVSIVCFQLYKEENIGYKSRSYRLHNIDLKQDHLFGQLIYRKYGSQCELE